MTRTIALEIDTSTSPKAGRSARAIDGRTVCADATLVDLVRGAIHKLVAGGDDEREIAIGLVEHHFCFLSEASPVTEDLRPWQLLASDLAAALAPIDEARAQRARRLADEIRAMVVMIARNPAAELAIRPASRRILSGLEAVGGREELGALRSACGVSASHMSNLMKPLRAHGHIRIEDGSDDRREKIVILTQKGRDALAERAKPVTTTAPAQTYPRYIERTTPEAEGIYPLAH